MLAQGNLQDTVIYETVLKFVSCISSDFASFD